MSLQNKLKRSRRIERTTRKAAAAERIPFGGVIVTRKDVLGQRYLADHGLPYSPSVAAVLID